MHKAINLDDRLKIEALIKSGATLREIAIDLGKSDSGILKEITLNGNFMGYNAQKAHQEAVERRKKADSKRVATRAARYGGNPNPYRSHESKPHECCDYEKELTFNLKKLHTLIADLMNDPKFQELMRYKDMFKERHV